MLSQLLAVFGFFSLILVAVYWVNRAVSLFDQIIGSGQTALVFFELSALSLPNVIRIVLPLSAFAATVFVTNRLASESELVVMQATGFSPFRLARPVLVFGLIVAAILSVLAHYLVPASRERFSERSTEISESVSARFLTEGQFLHPSDGITFYIRDISSTGELRDVFLSDNRQPDELTFYTAKRALFARVLVQDADLILLDEPAGGINPTLIERMGDLIRELNAGGKTFLLVEHNMPFVVGLCDPIRVLARGAVIAEGSPEQIQKNPLVLDAYLGDDYLLEAPSKVTAERNPA